MSAAARSSTQPPYAGFTSAAEQQLMDMFEAKGIVCVPAEDRTALDAIRNFLAAQAASALSLDAPQDAENFLNHIHKHVNAEALNPFRMSLMSAMQQQAWLRPAYYAIAKQAVQTIIGNELAMQRNVNLSIQLPEDDSSLLPVHSDVWSGDSPFEVVLWVPYVSCMRSKSMYFCDKGRDMREQRDMAKQQGATAEDLFHAIEQDVTFMDVPYGHVLLFTQNIMHGNRINQESETRWSSNCRFKSLLSPYADKKLGEFFEPITIRPATRAGMDYALPEGFGG